MFHHKRTSFKLSIKFVISHCIDYIHLKVFILNFCLWAGAVTQCKEHWLLWQRTQVNSQHPLAAHTILCNSSFRVSNTLSYGLCKWQHVVYTHMYVQTKHPCFVFKILLTYTIAFQRFFIFSMCMGVLPAYFQCTTCMQCP